MASQVVVISPTARQVTIKTKPETFLNDILAEACTKLRIDSGQYGLKYNNRELDLSNAMRHAGLTPGARLQLTLLSKSPSVINVALQLPSSNSSQDGGQRITDKFPSNTTLWMVLRKFEAGIAGQAKATNLTGRGAPRTLPGNNNSGRLYYETPVISNQGRTWRSFTDLQKTLAQLGFIKGSVLFRLSFEVTNTPLEESMAEIEQYFKAVDTESIPEVKPPVEASIEDQPQETPAEATQSPQNTQEVLDATMAEAPSPTLQESASATVSDAVVEVNSRPTTVFAPPTSDTPQAVLAGHNPQDFVPTVEHAKAHQALLSKASTNKRLLSDAEILAKQAEQAEKLAANTKVDIKLRFPDQSSVIATFSSEDTTDDLFDYTRNLLAKSEEPFGLQYASNKGNRPLPRGTQKLITDLGMTNRVLVSVTWEDGASNAARSGKSLKAEIAAQSKEIEVQAPPEIENEREEKSLQATNSEPQEKPRKGVPKWLKLPGKK